MFYLFSPVMGNGREVQGEGRGESRGRERDIPVPDWENEKVATLNKVA